MSQEGGIQALLVGGRADGYAVRLHELHRELVVFVNGVVHAEPATTPIKHLTPGATRYALVEPVGPEMPVYVQA